MRADINRHAMFYGLILGCVFCFQFLISTVPSVALSVLHSLVLLSLPFVAYFMVKNCRDRVCGGVISYSVALWYVIQLFLYASMISAMLKYLYFTLIDPDYLSSQFQNSMNILNQMSFLSSAMTEDAVDLARERATNPITVVFQSIWMNVLAALLIGLIVAGIVKRERSIFDNNDNLN